MSAGKPDKPLGEELLRCDNVRRNSAACLVLGLMWVLLCMFGKGGGFDTAEEEALITFAPPAVIALFAIPWSLIARGRMRRLALAVYRNNDALEAGALMLAARRRHAWIGEVARQGLLRLLGGPGVDEPSLGTEHLDWMHEQFNLAASGMSVYASERDIIAPLLAVVARIGTSASLRSVERLATCPWERFHAPAQAALPILRERVANMKSAGLLLRPTEQAHPDRGLLRPAGSSAGDSDSLLRPQ